MTKTLVATPDPDEPQPREAAPMPNISWVYWSYENEDVRHSARVADSAVANFTHSLRYVGATDIEVTK